MKERLGRDQLAVSIIDLISYPPEERDWEPGDLTVYRCSGCLDRWDLVWSPDLAAGDQ